MLFQHPGVHQAAVFGVPNRVMGELVAAAVTLRPEAQVCVGQPLWAAAGGGCRRVPCVCNACACWWVCLVTARVLESDVTAAGECSQLLYRA